MTKRRFFFGLAAVVYLGAVYGCPAWAAPTQQMVQGWGDKQGGDMPLLGEAQEEMLDKAQQGASSMLLGAAGWIDSFFDDRRSVAEVNSTRGTIKLSLGYSKNDDLEINPRFDLRLQLPKLSSRAQLVVQGANDSDFNVEDNPISGRTSRTDNERSEFTTALRYFLKESDKYNISFDFGLSWDYLYTGFRYRSIQDFDHWLGRFANRLRYYTDDGWENKSSYDLETQFHPKWLFRATSELHLYETEDGFPHSQYLRFYQVYSSHQALSYETGVFFDTQPSYKVTDIQLIVKYRQRFYRDWLVLEISPRVKFPEEHDRDADPGIIVKFEAAIGYGADVAGYRKIFQ